MAASETTAGPTDRVPRRERLDHDLGVWIILGVAWVVLNPAKKGDKFIDLSAPKRELTDAVPVG